jgi:hypothetical protein
MKISHGDDERSNDAQIGVQVHDVALKVARVAVYRPRGNNIVTYIKSR